MDERKLRESGFICLTADELLLRGGVSFNPFKFIKKAFDFIAEYGEDFIRGFAKGWRGY